MSAAEGSNSSPQVVPGEGGKKKAREGKYLTCALVKFVFYLYYEASAASPITYCMPHIYHLSLKIRIYQVSQK